MKELRIIKDHRVKDKLYVTEDLNNKVIEISIEDILDSLEISDISIYLDRRKKAIRNFFKL